MGKLAKRTKEQREADMNTLARLYVKGVSQMEIARQLGISQGQVSNDLKRLLAQWAETRHEDIDRYKQEQLMRVNLIEQEMWEAWEKSKTTPKTSISKSKSGEVVRGVDPVTGRQAKSDEDRYWRASSSEEMPTGGDMTYMNGIMWCQTERAKILGLYAPKKVAQTDPSGEHEAGTSAKEELMGMLSSIVNRIKPKELTEEQYVEAEIVEQIEAGEATSSDLPELAKRLRGERLKKLPAAEGASVDDSGAVLTTAQEVADGA